MFHSVLVIKVTFSHTELLDFSQTNPTLSTLVFTLAQISASKDFFLLLELLKSYSTLDIL